MRNPRIFLLLLVLCLPRCSPAAQQPSLSDLKSFDTIEKLMQFGDPKEACPERDYLHSLRDEIASASVEKRLGLLDTLSQQTKWGTYQRFIAYYVCAWHGVNYSRTRDYLIHCAFWGDWRIGPDSARPFNFDEGSVDLLYSLYERNHDFGILHDIVTTSSDAAEGEMIVCLTAQATVKHPRGLLHVAEISAKGRDLVCRLLHVSPNDSDHPLYILYGGEDSVKTLRSYVTRVAHDPKDPLSPLAKRLLKKPTRR